MQTTNDVERSRPRGGERLLDAPPSAKLVHWVLERNGPATQSQLADETLLPQRTVRYALDALEDVDFVQKKRYVPDARKKVYYAEPVRGSTQRHD